MKIHQHRIVTVVTACWVIVMPFVWARIYSWLVGCPYADILPRYKPEFAIAAAAAVLLPGAWTRKRWVGPGLVMVAVLLPALKVMQGSLWFGAWVLSPVLLLVTAWGTYVSVPAPSPDLKRLALRVLWIPVYGLAAIGTPPAFLHLAAGAFAGLEGIGAGRYFLGALLSAFSLFALLALWRLWSIGRRLWIHGACVTAAHGDRANDARGLLSAWIALAGFIAIGKPIYRTDEIVAFIVLLGPAAILATMAFLRSAMRGRTNVASDSREPADVTTTRPWFVLKLADLPGIACGVAIGLLGFVYFVPRPHSGWGPCDFSVIFPFYGSLWPTERPIIFDACSNDLSYLTFLANAASLVYLIVGALAAAIGREAAPRRAAFAAAIVMASVLVKAAFSVNDPDWPYVAWWPSLAVGVSAVAGAAWLGYIGGRRSARRMRKWLRTPERLER